VEACRSEGRKAWKQAVRYHRRSLAETAMYRYKQLIAPAFSLRTFALLIKYVYGPINSLYGL
jgi:hypothetical protein